MHASRRLVLNNVVIVPLRLLLLLCILLLRSNSRGRNVLSLVVAADRHLRVGRHAGPNKYAVSDAVGRDTDILYLNQRTWQVYSCVKTRRRVAVVRRSKAP